MLNNINASNTFLTFQKCPYGGPENTKQCSYVVTSAVHAASIRDGQLNRLHKVEHALN